MLTEVLRTSSIYLD